MVEEVEEQPVLEPLVVLKLPEHQVELKGKYRFKTTNSLKVIYIDIGSTST